MAHIYTNPWRNFLVVNHLERYILLSAIKEKDDFFDRENHYVCNILYYIISILNGYIYTSYRITGSKIWYTSCVYGRGANAK